MLEVKVFFVDKCLLIMLFSICGDVERLSGLEVMKQLSNTTGIKIVHQNIRRLFTNTESLTVLLNTYKSVDIVTLSETHITCNSWNDNSRSHSIPQFTFVSKCRQNGKLEWVGIYVAENLKWKRREDLEDVKTEGISIEFFNQK